MITRISTDQNLTVPKEPFPLSKTYLGTVVVDRNPQTTFLFPRTKGIKRERLGTLGNKGTEYGSHPLVPTCREEAEALKAAPPIWRDWFRIKQTIKQLLRKTK